ncbi:MAG: prepilin-type N-terminal cleavage/methylation domain-containing protein [Longimicrobiales bacterium]
MAKRDGYALIELMIAVVVLTVAVLGVAGSTGSIAVEAGRAETEAHATAAVDERISKISLDPRLPLLDSIYQTTETELPGLRGYSRSTVFDSVTVPLSGNNAAIYRRVTVSVAGPQLPVAISRTVVLGHR